MYIVALIINAGKFHKPSLSMKASKGEKKHWPGYARSYKNIKTFPDRVQVSDIKNQLAVDK